MSEGFAAIINPAAGGGRCGSRYREALDGLRTAGLTIEERVTERPGHGTELAAQAFREGIRRFIAVGGDGTSYEIVNGVMPMARDAGDRVRLGFLPLGTGNSFLRDFSTDGLGHARMCLSTGRVSRCDVLRAEHMDGEFFFINLASMGFVAQVGATANRRFKPMGEAGYILGVLSEVATLQPTSIRYRVDGGELRGDRLALLSVNNSQFTGGKMMMAPGASTSDGKLDVIEVQHLGRAGLLRTFPRIFKGTHVTHPLISQSRGERVVFDWDGAQDIMVDGEIVRAHLRSIAVLPGALEVYA